MTKGIDVSHWNNGDQIKRIVRDGDLDFIIAKYGQGDGMLDNSFFEYAQLADHYGKAFGGYYWINAHTSIDKIFKRLEEIYCHAYTSMRPIIDYEDKELLSDTNKAVSILDNVLLKFKTEYGTTPIIYGSYKVLMQNPLFDLLNDFEVDLWVARYKYGNALNLARNYSVPERDLQRELSDGYKGRVVLNQISNRCKDPKEGSGIDLDGDVCFYTEVLWRK